MLSNTMLVYAILFFFFLLFEGNKPFSNIYLPQATLIFDSTTVQITTSVNPCHTVNSLLALFHLITKVNRTSEMNNSLPHIVCRVSRHTPGNPDISLAVQLTSWWLERRLPLLFSVS